MRVDSISGMDGTEKPKAGLFVAVLPSVWFVKLRSMRKKSRSLRAAGNDLVTPDSAPFLPKAVENCYKHALGSENRSFSSLQGHQSPCSLGREENHDIPATMTPTRKSVIRSEATATTTPVTSIAATTSSSSSVFSRCMYRSTFFSGVRSLCKLVGDDETLSRKGDASPAMQFRKTSMPTMRQWFLVGCGGAPRPRARHSSLDLEKEPGLMEMDAESGQDGIDERTELQGSWPGKSASWSGAKPNSWVDLNDEVVKNQVVVTKKIFPQSKDAKGAKDKSPVRLAPGTKPTLAHLFSTRTDTDSPVRTFPDTEEDSEVHLEDPKLVSLPWKSTSFGSDSTFRVPSLGSDYGLALSGRKPYFSFSPPGAYTEEFDDGNISDSQSLLREKVLAAKRLCEGSMSLTDQRKMDTKQKDEEAMKLLASLDQALDQHNLKKLIDDEEEDSGSTFGSTRFELHNSPVFESFLESSAKAWGIDFPSLKNDGLKTSRSVTDRSRELHCVSVQTASQMEKARAVQAQERDHHRGREPARSARLNSASPAKTRKMKRPVEKEVSRKPSISRKALQKNVQEERTIHPQREESMVDPDVPDDFVHARRKLNEAKKRGKQRRPKHVSPAVRSPPAPKQQPSVVKERVVVVVESSYDPYNDFRESMIEMIVDQDIQEIGDLEELLQCYLSLNESEYHNVIVDVFTDVWHELFENKS